MQKSCTTNTTIKANQQLLSLFASLELDNVDGPMTAFSDGVSIDFFGAREYAKKHGKSTSDFTQKEWDMFTVKV